MAIYCARPGSSLGLLVIPAEVNYGSDFPCVALVQRAAVDWWHQGKGQSVLPYGAKWAQHEAGEVP